MGLIRIWIRNVLARNVVIFGIDNSSPSLSDNCRNNFLILGEGPTSDYNGSFGSPEKKSLVLILVKETKKILLNIG